jgi:hypothetical protein
MIANVAAVVALVSFAVFIVITLKGLHEPSINAVATSAIFICAISLLFFIVAVFEKIVKMMFGSSNKEN